MTAAKQPQKQPRFVIKLDRDEGYYSGRVSWRGVPRDKATWLTHAEALRIRNHLTQSRIGCHPTIEPL